MRIKFVEIQNFRRLESVRIDFAEQTTLLVGANNSGKTSAMEALGHFLVDKNRFTTKDFTLSPWNAANKIGTFSVAVLAKYHGIPFYVAAPTSTFDMSIANGSCIPIEERSPDEIKSGFGSKTAPDEVSCYCPAFDVTPAELIAGIVTERGIIRPVNKAQVAGMLKNA